MVARIIDGSLPVPCMRKPFLCPKGECGKRRPGSELRGVHRAAGERKQNSPIYGHGCDGCVVFGDFDCCFASSNKLTASE